MELKVLTVHCHCVYKNTCSCRALPRSRARFCFQTLRSPLYSAHANQNSSSLCNKRGGRKKRLGGWGTHRRRMSAVRSRKPIEICMSKMSNPPSLRRQTGSCTMDSAAHREARTWKAQRYRTSHLGPYLALRHARSSHVACSSAEEEARLHVRPTDSPR